MTRTTIFFSILLPVLMASCNNVSGPGDKEDKSSPVVTLTSPVGGEELIGTHTITWSINEPNRYKVELQLSRDSGVTYAEVISSLAPDTGTYNWNTNSVSDCRKCRIRIVATDTVGNVSVPSESASDFVVNNVPEVIGESLYFHDPVANTKSLVIPFDKEIDLRGTFPGYFIMPVSGDSFGSAATLVAGPGRDQVTINLDMADPKLHVHVNRAFSRGWITRTAPSGIDVVANLPTGIITAVDTGRTAAPSEGADIVPTFSDSGQVFGNTCRAVKFGDIDGDGDLDMIRGRGGETGSPAKNLISVWLNQGGLQAGVNGAYILDVTLGANASDTLALGDIDGDGDLDIFAGIYNAPNEIWINQGGLQAGSVGTFLAGTNIDTTVGGGTGQTKEVILADVDSDNDLDLIISDTGPGVGGVSYVWLNQGGLQGGTEGVFLDSMQTLGNSYTESLAVGDVDGDGDIDIVEGNNSLANVIWINQGGSQAGVIGTYTDSGQSLSVDTTYDILLSDLDGDGDLDIVEANDGTNKIWTNQGGDQGGTVGEYALAVETLGGGRSWSIAAADVDNDGDLDLAIGTDTLEMDVVWINQGGDQQGAQGQFKMRQEFGIISNGTSQVIEFADVDGDLDQDLITMGTTYTYNRIYINSMYHPTNPMMIDSTQAAGAEDATDVALGDLDGDGDLDIVSADFSSTRVWFNQGMSQGGTLGTFLESDQAFGADNTKTIALGDVDNDGDVDIVAGNNRTQSDRVWINQGGIQGGIMGLFLDSGQLLNSKETERMVLGDVDGDGDLDLVNSSAFDSFDKTGVWFNQGGNQGGVIGTFVHSGFNIGGYFGLALADVDNDGDLDLGTTSLFGGSKIQLNQGGVQAGLEGEFLSAGNFTSEVSQSIVFGDIDNDGDMDIATSHTVTGQNNTWINQGGSQGGALGSFLLGQFINRETNNSLVLGDLDGDGDLDMVQGSQYVNKIFLNQGGIQKGVTGNYLEHSQVFDNINTYSIALGDLDNDGDLDMVEGNRSGTPNRIWLNDQ